ncbi:MAG: prolipoprotein diacylglyceryl transferase [Hornefia sp.]|nr:prolipoprotein diacylglyceryl transferase [Hornefia sp.]
MTSPGPVAFSMFGYDIMWYGILIALSFLTAIYISYRRANLFSINPEEIFNLSMWIIPLSVAGARLYYVVFSWKLYENDYLSVFNIREGGLAIHGGLIAGGLFCVFFCKYKNISLPDLADLLLPSVALAQSIGRWGNFFNSEAHGTKTTLPWGIIVDGVKVHPTFLYESVWCLLLFFLLNSMIKRRKFSGQIAMLYGILYSLERFFVEGLRTDSLMLGPFRQAQLLSLFLIALSLSGYIYLHKKSSSRKSDS